MRRADQVLERHGDAAQRAAVKFSLGSFLIWGMADLDAGPGADRGGAPAFSSRRATNAPACLPPTRWATTSASPTTSPAMPPTPARWWSKGPVGGRRVPLPAGAVLAGVGAGSERAHRANRSRWSRSAIDDRREDRPGLPAFLPDRHAGLAARPCSATPAPKETSSWPEQVNPAYRVLLLLDFTRPGGLAGRRPGASVTAALDQIAWDGGVGLRRALGAATAVTAMAEMGRATEAAELQATIDRTFPWPPLVDVQRDPGLVRGPRSPPFRATGAPASSRSPASQRKRRRTATGSGPVGYWPIWPSPRCTAATRRWPGGRAHGSTTIRLHLARGANEGLRAFGGRCRGLRRLRRGRGRGSGLEQRRRHFEAAGWQLFEGRALALLGHCSGRDNRERGHGGHGAGGSPLRGVPGSGSSPRGTRWLVWPGLKGTAEKSRARRSGRPKQTANWKSPAWLRMGVLPAKSPTGCTSASERSRPTWPTPT